MLFISRYIWRDNIVHKGICGATDKILFGVVDTDDDMESIVAWRDIERVSHVGIDINGVELAFPFRSVRTITPWQDKNSVSTMQVKSSVLWHTDVTMWNGRITSIIWHSEHIYSPVELRLSDFGDCCEDCILYDNFGSGSISPTGEIGTHKITLVLDDKIRISPDTFRVGGTSLTVLGKGGMGVVLDLRELTDDNRADIVYESLHRYYGDPLDSVIDNPERIERVRQRWVERLY